MNKKLSVTEYANLRSCSRQYVLKCLADRVALDGVKKREFIGKTWVLTVEIKYYEKLSMQASKGFEQDRKK